MSVNEEIRYPMLPLRDVVIFPHMVIPLFVGRKKSILALEEAMDAGKNIFLAAQMDATDDDPGPEQIYQVGTIANILQLLKLPDGTVKVLVEGGERVQAKNVKSDGDYITAENVPVPSEITESEEIKILAKTVLEQFEDYVKMNKKIPAEVVSSVSQIKELDRQADIISSHLSLKLEEKQALLELTSTAERLEKIFQHIEKETGVLSVEKTIRTRVKKQMEKTQRDYYLNEQMKAIKKELHDDDGEGIDEIEELTDQIQETKLSKEARKKADKEIKKLKQMPPMSAEATVSRNYLDWILSVPWGKKSRVHKDIRKAKKIVDADHYGLEKVKERILEYLAVQQRTSKVKGPILCLVGPPGVGKTSLGQSIAKATNRKYVRMSLGGVRDESEIRGHRRTYI